METIKKIVFDLKQIIKNDNDSIPREDTIELNLTFNIESIRKAIENYLKTGNIYDRSFFLWTYDISDRNSSYSTPKNQVPMAEVIDLYIDDKKEYVWAEIMPISNEINKYKDDDNFTLSMQTETLYNQKSIIVKSINGVIIFLNSADEELVKGSQVLVVKRSHAIPGKGIGNGASFKIIEEIKIDENENKFYLVDGNWFGSDGLLTHGRGIRIKKMNGQNLS